MTRPDMRLSLGACMPDNAKSGHVVGILREFSCGETTESRGTVMNSKQVFPFFLF